jgi:hypothetical protein
LHERLGANGTGKLHFAVDDAVDVNNVTLAESRMTIDSDGDVGIGTTSPQEKLHIYGSSTTRVEVEGADHAYFKASSSSRGYGVGTSGTSFKIYDYNAAADRVVVANSGNVGIGTGSPVAKLDIAGTTALNDNQLRLRGGADGFHWLGYHTGGGFDGAKLYGLQTVALQTSNMEVVLRNGRMGVGTASPGKGKLHVAGWQNDYVSGGTYFSAGFGGLSGFGPSGQDISIYGERHILAGWGLLTESDARIKNIQGISDAATDLETLTQIEITDYTMKDYVQAGNDAYKKVIAQQVESVYPLAVSNTTNFIPNVYELTQMENGKASVATNLEEGDKVKLYINDSEEAIANVVSKTDNTVSFDVEYTGKAFIYGKEVDDFKIVDYEAIAMLNVSATQELFKLITALQEENTSLKADVSQLKSMSEDIELLKEAMGIDLKASK